MSCHHSHILPKSSCSCPYILPMTSPHFKPDTQSSKSKKSTLQSSTFLCFRCPSICHASPHQPHCIPQKTVQILISLFMSSYTDSQPSLPMFQFHMSTHSEHNYIFPIIWSMYSAPRMVGNSLNFSQPHLTLALAVSSTPPVPSVPTHWRVNLPGFVFFEPPDVTCNHNSISWFVCSRLECWNVFRVWWVPFVWSSPYRITTTLQNEWRLFSSRLFCVFVLISKDQCWSIEMGNFQQISQCNISEGRFGFTVY